MEKKLKATKAATICYGFGDLASQFVWTYVGSYLTIYYTDIVGLAPAAVSVIMMLARIWDAINDPMMGAIAERTRSKFGRFRPYIAFGAPFLAIFSVLTFTNPFSGKSTAGVIWAAAIYIIAGMLYTLVNIPYGAMAAVMTEDADQRNILNTSRKYWYESWYGHCKWCICRTGTEILRSWCRSCKWTGIQNSSTYLCNYLNPIILDCILYIKRSRAARRRTTAILI